MPNFPPVFRPGTLPKVLQRKQNVGQATPTHQIARHNGPLAPPVYRPQPLPKVLQPKQSITPTAAISKIIKRDNSVAPAVYRPQPLPRVLQKKPVNVHSVSSGNAVGEKSPVAPPVYRPSQVTETILRNKRPNAQAVSRTSRPHLPVAPPVYRPNGTPVVLQAKKNLNISHNGFSPTLLPKPDRGKRFITVIQPYFTIKGYPTNGDETEFNKEQGTDTKKLIKFIDTRDKPFGAGWKGFVGKAAGDTEDKGTYNSLDEFKVWIAENKPPMNVTKRKKLDEKNERRVKQKLLEKKVDQQKVNKGKKLGIGSLRGGEKFINEMKKHKVFNENIKQLETQVSSENTKSGYTFKLNTGNINQSMTIYGESTFPENTTSIFLEDKGLVTKKVTPSPFPTVAFTQVPERLSLTSVPGLGAYEVDKEMNNTLISLEQRRLPWTVVPDVVRGNFDSKNVNDPLGNYALYELLKATTGNDNVNKLMQNNIGNIFEKSQTLDTNIKLGEKTTLGNYIDSFNQLTTKKPTKETQNRFNYVNFDIYRTNFGSVYDEEDNEIEIKTPPSSPFDPNLY